MGRPENPIPDPSSPLGVLATALRSGRRRVGLSYAQLAEQTRFCSPGTLQRAASGTVLPRHDVALSFAQACGLNIDDITQLWLAAHRGSRGGIRKCQEPAPQPHLIEDLEGLCSALEELRLANGAPSYRVMENRARASGKELSRSTAYRICSQRQAPTTIECLEAFLVACEVLPRSREPWFEAFLRLQRDVALGRRDAAERAQMRQLEAVVAENDRGEVTQETAVRLLRRAGFEARERYRRFETPWTVECLQCAATFRLRLSDVLLGQATCLDCPRLNDQVREAWAELLTNRSRLLSRHRVRALRAASVLQARLQRNHLEVTVFVADRATGAALQSTAWHPALEASLRRHIRRPFSLDILLVYDYDSLRNGHRQRRLAKAAGLVHGPLESAPPAKKSHLPRGTVRKAAERSAGTAIPRTVRADRTTPLPKQGTSNSGP
ncbi:helix-turn-helix domain-containing protein [Streptomyces sp. NPDC019531]|uniref:helix-turn-helix domain-containing protein n=1 Tax=Streptomyces sp. NPDC019531 TaxID=3365062 RepID=UPI00384C6900